MRRAEKGLQHLPGPGGYVSRAGGTVKKYDAPPRPGVAPVSPLCLVQRIAGAPSLAQIHHQADYGVLQEMRSDHGP